MTLDTSMTLITAPPARRRLDQATIRLRHRIFSAGTGTAADIRGWHRWMRWRERDGVGWRLRRAAHLAALPATAARDAYAAVRRLGAQVERVGGGSPARQFAQLWWLRVRHGIDTQSYVNFQLYRPERRRRAPDFIQVTELRSATILVNRRTGAFAEAVMLSDKARFDKWCAEHGLRSVPTLFEVEESGVVGGTIDAGALPAHNLFSKPKMGRSGIGARLWRWDGEGGYVGRDGRTHTSAQLLDQLAADARRLRRPILVQEALRTHHALSDLTTGGLATMRLVTYRPPRGAVGLLLGVLKMPVGDMPVDNVAKGAMAADIDIDTGVLGAAVRRDGHLFVGADRHTDTGATIAGRQLPCWAEAVDLVIRAHAATERLALLGWDVAVVDSGPVLVEGNTRSSSRVMQLSGVPLTDTPLPRALHDYVRESFRM